MSQKPHRCRTWAPRGQTPVLEFNFNWDKLSVSAGLTLRNFYFRLYPGAIGELEVIDFLKALLRHLDGPLLIVWDRLPAHRSRLAREFIQLSEDHIATEYLPPYARRVSSPPRWYVDLTNTSVEPEFGRRLLTVGGPAVRGVRVGEDGFGNTRVVFDLRNDRVPDPLTSVGGPGLTVTWTHASGDGGLGSTLSATPFSGRDLPAGFLGKPAATESSALDKPAEEQDLSAGAVSFQRFSMSGLDAEAAESPPIVLAQLDVPQPPEAAASPPLPPLPPPLPPAHVPGVIRAEDLKQGVLRRVNTPLAHLGVGQRVKIEGKRFRDGKLVATAVEFVDGDDDDFEIEGIITKFDGPAGRFSMGPLQVETYERTQFQNQRREPTTVNDFERGMRVKVKAKRIKDGFVRARTVRAHSSNRDKDFEIEAAIEHINLAKSELSVLPGVVTITGGTDFEGFGFTAYDKYADNSKMARFIRRDDDAQHPDPIRIGPAYIGGRTQFEMDVSRNLDLNEDDPDSDDWYRTSGQVEVAAPLGEYSEVYAKFNFAQGFYDGNNPTLSNRGEVRFREGFIYLGNFFHRSLGLHVGRQRFRDKREWLYDERLDAVRLHFTRRRSKAEMSVAQSIFSESTSREDQLYLIGHSQYRFPGRRYLSGYVIKRNDTSRRDEDPIWFGLSSRGRITRKLNYWGEWLQMRGRRGSRLLRGYGYDFDGSYKLPLPWESTISAGYAYGSGDKDFKDGIDGNFRQTRLNDNSSRYNGLKRYRYYGVLLEPELYNMKITTLDYGIRPSRKWSFNFAYHTYRQAVADDNFGDLELKVEPLGKDPRLGKELDCSKPSPAICSPSLDTTRRADRRHLKSSNAPRRAVSLGRGKRNSVAAAGQSFSARSFLAALATLSVIGFVAVQRPSIFDSAEILK